MSKNELYSYKKWYGVEVGTGKRKGIKKLRVTREFNSGQNKYEIFSFENNSNNEIDSGDLIKGLEADRKIGDDKISNKFNKGNILFNLKLKNRSHSILNENEVIKKYDVIKQTEKLAAKDGISKNNIKDELNKSYNGEDYITINNIKIKIYNNSDIDKGFRDEKEYAISIIVLNDDEIEERKNNYKLCSEINKALLKIFREIEKDKTIFINRNYIERLRKKIFDQKRDLEEIISYFEKIKESKKIDEDLNISSIDDKYFRFLLNTKSKSDYKKHFDNKIIDCIFNGNCEINDDDIANFLVGEIKYYRILERKQVEINYTSRNDLLNRKVKTYVSNDIHITYEKKQEDKNKVVKKLLELENDNKLKSEFDRIFDLYKVKDLYTKIKEGYDKGLKVDTYVFQIYKDHYKSIYNYGDKENNKYFDDKEDYEKQIYKIIYRYLKGIVNKCVEKGRCIDFGKDKKRLEETREKTYSAVKQFILEHVLYIGKREHYEFALKNTNDYRVAHGEEELYLEILSLFTVANLNINDYYYLAENGQRIEGIFDFFGDKFKSNKLKLKEENVGNDNIFEKLGFASEEDNLIYFQNASYDIRNGIIHNNHSKFKNAFKTVNNLENNLGKKLINTINSMKPTDEEICQSINLEIVFKDKSELIKKINNINDELDNDKIYYPSFSKVNKELCKILESKSNILKFENSKMDIIKNAFIYVNKILYLKMIGYKDSDFKNNYMKNEKFYEGADEKFAKKEYDIASEYKKAQIRASKGDKFAVRRFQNKIINNYIEWLETNNEFNNIFEFDSLCNFTDDEVKDKIKNNKLLDNKYILKGISLEDIIIKNNFEYVIGVCCLLSENIYVNKIKNRLVSTKFWIESIQNKNYIEYDNAIKLLDEIISIKNINKNMDKTMNIDNIEWYEERYYYLTEHENGKEINEKIKNKEFNFDNNKIDETSILIVEEIKALLKENLKNDISEKYCVETILDGLYRGEIDVRGPERNKRIILRNREDIKEKISDTRKDIIDNKAEINKLINDVKEEAENSINKFENNYKNELYKYPVAKISKYKGILEDISNDDNSKFKEIYYNELKDGNKKCIYKSNLYNVISKGNFNVLYDNFLKDDLMNLTEEDINVLNDKCIPEKIKNVDKALTDINNKLKGFDKNYKERYIENVKILSDEFYADFKKVQNYKKIKSTIEFNILEKINYYLISINWKLLIQIFRVERDLHYIMKGLGKLELVSYSIDNERKKSKAFAKIEENEYKLDSIYYVIEKNEYEKYVSLCKFFGIDLEKGELVKKKEKSIRNYIAHMYIVRYPFKDIGNSSNNSIISKIRDIDKLLKYRTKYNNSTINSVFEVFKKDYNLNYDELKKVIDFDDFKVEKYLSEKDISVLKLKSNNNVEIINKLLTLYINN